MKEYRYNLSTMRCNLFLGHVFLCFLLLLCCLLLSACHEESSYRSYRLKSPTSVPEIPGEEPAPPTPEIPGEEPDLEICNDPNTMDSELPGLGTANDPFVLCSPAHLALLGHFMYSSSSFNYVMGQNIDLKNQDASPIANFSGILNGRGKKIMNPTIHVTTGNAALFLTLRVGGTVKNLGIEMADVEGRDYVGSLVAINFGRIKDCYATGSRV